ncbi:MAG: hypothetical protein ACO3EZ_00360 [Prochlorotrichaceae cyanobacterium]
MLRQANAEAPCSFSLRCQIGSITVAVTVTGKNDRPIVDDISVVAIEDGDAITSSFIVSDVDTTDTHTFQILTAPSGHWSVKP